MIKYIDGDLFTSKCEAWVNPVNCLGVSGAGVAAIFRDLFPENQEEYRFACARGKFTPGTARVFATGTGKPEYIINVATKGHWKKPSQLKWIQKGLHQIWCRVNEHEIESIAMPALGCGNGGLEWEDVKLLIEKIFSEVPAVLPDLKVEVYLPKTTNQNEKNTNSQD